MDYLMEATELSEYLKVKSQTIYNWVAQAKIPHTKIGDVLRFKKSDIDNWLRKKTNFPNRIGHKAYQIEPSPYQVLIDNKKKWALRVYIWRDKGYEISEQPFTSHDKGYFDNKDAAIIHSLELGKHIIDNRPELLSI